MRKLKRILATLLALCMCFSIPITSYAAGSEVWDGYGTVLVGEFTMTGHNLTPVKTSGWTGKLAITTYFDSTKSNVPVILRVEIRDYETQKVLGYSVTSAQTSGSVVTYADNLKWHQKIQIFFKVYDQNGNYSTSRPCWIKYYYSYYNAQ